MKIKKIIAFVTACIMAAGILSSAVFAIDEPKDISTRTALVYSVEADRVLWSRGGDEKTYPASTVKLMTALIACEHFADSLDTKITISEEVKKKSSGTTVGFAAGDVFTARELLYGLVCGSGNDAAYALAYAIAGSDTEFVRMMNERARELGMDSTTYANPTGVHDPSMITTASDTLKVAIKCHGNSLFAELCKTRKATLESQTTHKKYNVSTKNALLTPSAKKYYYAAATGMNSGLTYEAGYSLVASARKDGASYIAVVLGASSETKVVTPAQRVENPDGTVTETEEVKETTVLSYIDAKTLIEWASTSFEYKTVIGSSDIVRELPVKLGAGVDHVVLMPKESLEYYLPVDVDPKTDVEYEYEYDSEYLEAPVKRGTVVGRVIAKYDGEILGQTELITRNGVERSGKAFFFANLAAVAKSPAFIICVILAVAALLIYLATIPYRNAKRRAKAMREYYRNNRDKWNY